MYSSAMALAITARTRCLTLRAVSGFLVQMGDSRPITSARVTWSTGLLPDIRMGVCRQCRTPLRRMLGIAP